MPDILGQEALEIAVKRASELTETEQAQLDAMGRVCFEGDPYASEFEWSQSEWSIVGRLDGQVVSHVGLIQRGIMVGGISQRVGGVGGVMTLPGYRRRGLAAALMGQAESTLRDDFKVEFGVLVCSPEMVAYYRRCGWEYVGDGLDCQSFGKDAHIPGPVMILRLSSRAWPGGTIDLCGTPW